MRLSPLKTLLNCIFRTGSLFTVQNALFRGAPMKTLLVALFFFIGCDPSADPTHTSNADSDLMQLPANELQDSGVVSDATITLAPGISVLLMGPPSADLEITQNHLQSIFNADPDSSDIQIQTLTTPTPVTEYWLHQEMSLMMYFYQYTDRAARMAALEGDWDHVILVDLPLQVIDYPELHFEGVRTIGNIFEDQNASVHLLMAPSSLNNSYFSDYVEHTYRVGVGTQSNVIPAAIAAQNDQAATTDHALYSAVSIYSSLRNLPASHASYTPLSHDAQAYETLAQSVHETLQTESSTTHYDTPFVGVVKMVNAELPDTYRFITSGTSSERGYRNLMVELLEDQGLTAAYEEIGTCNANKSVDQECMERAVVHCETADYMSIYARGYDVSTSDFVAAGGGDIQLQVYDRHWDNTENDGNTTLDQIEYRTAWFWNSVLTQELAFLPQHINFAKLKVQDPQANLLTDGVHATNAVQYGLAAMSFVSRTGQPIVLGDDEEKNRLAQLGEETIRQWATLSESGIHTPED
jgi:hypothetical protein